MKAKPPFLSNIRYLSMEYSSLSVLEHVLHTCLRFPTCSTTRYERRFSRFPWITNCISLFAGARISQLANQLNYDREVIRVWFCNKRQSFRNSNGPQSVGPPMPFVNKPGEQPHLWFPFAPLADYDMPIDLSTKRATSFTH